jgi:hypothetical protein
MMVTSTVRSFLGGSFGGTWLRAQKLGLPSSRMRPGQTQGVVAFTPAAPATSARVFYSAVTQASAR